MCNKLVGRESFFFVFCFIPSTYIYTLIFFWCFRFTLSKSLRGNCCFTNRTPWLSGSPILQLDYRRYPLQMDLTCGRKRIWKKNVLGVDTNPMLPNLNKTTREIVSIAFELMRDIFPILHNFEYNRSLTASPFCHYNSTEATAAHLRLDCQAYKVCGKVQFVQLRTTARKWWDFCEVLDDSVINSTFTHQKVRTGASA